MIVGSNRLTHLRLTTANGEAFCGTKCDRYTRVEVFPNNVTCLTCLVKATAFHTNALDKIVTRHAEVVRRVP